MSKTRIKNLQSAKPLIDKQFDEFQFIVDVENPDATLKVTGRDLKEAVGNQPHTHPIEEVEMLPGELEKKFDKAGGAITGDLKVLGNTRMKNLSIDEYLEVPEMKYNRITATGNEFWVTDAGVVDDWYESKDGIFCVSLKAKEGERSIQFQYKDILRGVFKTETGFSLAFFEVTAIIDETNFDCIALNGVAPARFMTLARQGNKSNPLRQGSVYLDGLKKQIRVLDGIKDEHIDLKNIKVHLGDLSEINHPIFGQLSGYGALLENAFISGRLVQRNPDTGEEWVVGAVSVQGELVFHYDSNGEVDNQIILLTASEQGFSSVPADRYWQYKQGDEWIDIEGEQNLSFSLRHDDPIWKDRKVIALRYLAKAIYYDIITISKLFDGIQGEEGIAGISMQGFSTPGFQFYREGQVYSASLWVEVYQGENCITESFDLARFLWQRTSENPSGDAIWNDLHFYAGNMINIREVDLAGDTSFCCSLLDNDKQILKSIKF